MKCAAPLGLFVVWVGGYKDVAPLELKSRSSAAVRTAALTQWRCFPASPRSFLAGEGVQPGSDYSLPMANTSVTASRNTDTICVACRSVVQ